MSQTYSCYMSPTGTITLNNKIVSIIKECVGLGPFTIHVRVYEKQVVLTARYSVTMPMAEIRKPGKGTITYLWIPQIVVRTALGLAVGEYPVAQWVRLFCNQKQKQVIISLV